MQASTQRGAQDRSRDVCEVASDHEKKDESVRNPSGVALAGRSEETEDAAPRAVRVRTKTSS